MDVRNYIGAPYNLYGSSLEEGFNCYTLVVDARRNLYGLPMPEIALDVSKRRNHVREIQNQYNSGAWKEVTKPEPSDIVLMKPNGKNLFSHIGLAVERGYVLHAYDTGVIASPINLLPQLYVERKYFRWPQ